MWLFWYVEIFIDFYFLERINIFLEDRELISSSSFQILDKNCVNLNYLPLPWKKTAFASYKVLF